MTDIFDYLRARPYPGRGILLGAAPDGAPVCAYFIMGRSENSRNRVFELRKEPWNDNSGICSGGTGHGEAALGTGGGGRCLCQDKLLCGFGACQAVR